jgi:hypothetical protein
MSKSFDLAVAFMQLFLLVLWEALGALYFGWSPVAVFFCWLAGIFTLNIATATVLRTFIKLTQLPAEEAPVEITEDDLG